MHEGAVETPLVVGVSLVCTGGKSVGLLNVPNAMVAMRSIKSWRTF